MSKFRINHKVARQMLSEPNCAKVVRQISSIIKSPWFSQIDTESKRKLLIYVQEIERRNKCLEWDRLKEIKKFVSELYKTYNK
ncbi:MAG: hypothetical protein IKZ49_03920 [Alphaproteobacteria bacterium]|nr:hypothetical protein [Alphaproteobacteria bacterium]